MIIANSLSKKFQTETVFRNLDLQVNEGEFVSIVGPSGCGKSTLLRMVSGLDSFDTGELLVNGHAPHKLNRETQKRSLKSQNESVEIAYVFQSPTLLPWRNVRHNVELPLELKKVKRDNRVQRVTDALRLVGLDESDESKLPRMLSGGMQMRVSLARAVVMTPRIMLLDEPFGALDDMLRQNLNEELTQMWLQQKWTALFVTHNVFEAVFMSQRVLVMSGRPSRVVREIAIPFAYPRLPELRSTPEFARLAGDVSAALQEAKA